ncbi:Indole-3-acetic acid-amido synthetase GH3.17 [Hibiscus syriacus]|uniref:Indole-3-acetic acid-amido synthetase GH3.17 n=1 Tax=Hibiscus syriacus TaxID=106335 RepID=A0A6A2XE50_HIBSY|nr:Indole-3-acetic acid-amido synthetase GH3.17 [Hibiscus syriacus]
MATNDYESGLNLLEELTTNAQQIQDQLLGEMLRENAGTEYLRRFLHGQTDKQLFKKNVPIVAYEDLKPYIDRIASGEASSDILLAAPITGFFRRQGISLPSLCGKPKLIPVISETDNFTAMFGNLFRSVMKNCGCGCVTVLVVFIVVMNIIDDIVFFFAVSDSLSSGHYSVTLPLFESFAKGMHMGDIDKAGKRMELMFTKPELETPSGLKASAASTRVYNASSFRAILPKLYTSPFETIVCRDTRQSIDRITDSGCRNAASLILKPNPELADLIENICSFNSWDGIIRKLWPKTKYIGAVCTGSMMQYTAELEFYCGGLPLVSGFYGCSEGALGINLDPLCKPSDVLYTFLPIEVYYEFIPIKDECVMESRNQVEFSGVSHKESIEASSNGEDTEPVELVNVKPGQCYELLVTSSSGLYRYRVGDVVMVTGFYNNTPQFRFVGRQNVALAVDWEKTSEADLLKAVTEAKTLLDPIGFILTEFTSYSDTSSTPGHYVILWELKPKEGNDCNEVDPKVMEECCSRIEDSLHFTYRLYRKENIIAALEIRVVKQGTFEALMDYFVSQGASLSQYKTPICLKSEEALEILDSRVIAKFFSPTTPI